MNKIKLNTVGADIEVFLKDKITNEIVSAEGIIPGTKDEPHYYDPNDKYASLQLDNVLCEFTVKPATNVKEWIIALNRSMEFIKSFIPKNLDVAILPSASLHDRFLQTEQAQLFGCQPDFNAHTANINCKPFAEDETLRSCGNHIHLGFDDIEVPFDGIIEMYEVDEQRANIVKALDLFISVPLVIMEPDSKRKELYGKAGAFRPKSYGK